MSEPSARSSLVSTASGHSGTTETHDTLEDSDSGLISALEEIVLSTGGSAGEEALAAVKQVMKAWPRPSKDLLVIPDFRVYFTVQIKLSLGKVSWSKPRRLRCNYAVASATRPANRPTSCCAAVVVRLIPQRTGLA